MPLLVRSRAKPRDVDRPDRCLVSSAATAANRLAARRLRMTYGCVVERPPDRLVRRRTHNPGPLPFTGVRLAWLMNRLSKPKETRKSSASTHAISRLSGPRREWWRWIMDMSSLSEFAAFVGIDWVDRKHNVCLLPAGAAKRESSVLPPPGGDRAVG